MADSPRRGAPPGRRPVTRVPPARASEPDTRARGVVRRARPDGEITGSRLARLWEAIRRTRAELDAREDRRGAIGERFVATIRPREEHFTRAVWRMTERLVRHHEGTTLAADERTLLGLWVNENLQSLADHPFAPRAETEALASRWRRHLGMAEHPLDAPLASLYARQAHGGPRRRRDAPDDAAADAAGRRGGEGGRDGRGGQGAGSRDGQGGRDASNRSARRPDGAEHELHELLARLFRRLARVLHPDREPDENRRRDKHRLMSDCLRARDERDVDALLSLYAAHVGEPSAALAGDDVARLEQLLRSQLSSLQRRLRTRHFGDALQRLIVDRYASDDPAESERRFVAHARALDVETAHVERLERLVGEAEGLRRALAGRRERELDRLSIDELTGMASG